ncbi:MAG TPA: hypothetical protein VLE97_05800 [Gaiellaceae bacterium]|nr:hypothetical protein [Gaiellaceae bacterium]
MYPFMNPGPGIGVNIADISEEMREKALKRTADIVRKIDEVRRTAELAPEHLPIVVDIYGKVVSALVAEAAREEIAQRTQRLPMTMRSEDKTYQPLKIKPGKDADGNYFCVVVRPQCVAYRVEDIAIHGDRSRWKVHDIMVGNRSQFVGHHGPAAGTEFGPGGILEHVKLETLQTAMDFKLVVEYVGPEPDGEVFEATVVGLSVDC